MQKTRTKQDSQERARRYYQEHKEIIKARSRKWRKDNQERARAYRREYYRTHYVPHPRKKRAVSREEILARSRVYRARRIARDREGYLEYHRNYWRKNRKRLLAQKKIYREEHRDEINAKKRVAWRKKVRSQKRGK